MATQLFADALFPPPNPDQLNADLDAVGAHGAFVYVWRPGGVGNWTPNHVARLRERGKLAIPIIVPYPVGGDANAQLDSANAFGFAFGPVTLDLEPPNLPPSGWEEGFDAIARGRGFWDFDYGTPSNLGLYQPDDENWKATWIRTGILEPLPVLPSGWFGWQFVNDVVVNGTQYDFSVINDVIFVGGGPMPVDQHLVSQAPIHGKVMAGAAWYNWGDALTGALVPVVGFPAPTVGDDVTMFEFVHFGGQWVDRVGPVAGQGDWCLLDQFVDTLDVSGCIDPPTCVSKFNPPPSPVPPPPPPAPPPPPSTGPSQADFDALKKAFETHQHGVTTSGTSGRPQ